MSSAQDTQRAEAIARIVLWSERASETDGEILKRYCDEQRAIAAGQAAMLRDGLDQDDRVAAAVAKYGTDEG